jgi:hypothetical protein
MSETTPPLDRSPLLRELRQGKFDFLDLGCSRGGSIDQAKRLFNAERGLGIDIDSKKIEEATAAGHDAVAFDIHELPNRPLVRFAIMSHFLEHIPNRKDVGLFIRHAISSSREFVFIRQPYFDADGYLYRRELKLYWSDWHGHPNTMSTFNFHSILAPLRNKGIIGDFSIHLRGPIASSAHDAVHPVGAASGQHEYDPALHPPKPMDVTLDDVFEETMVFITKPGIEHHGPFGNVKFDRTVFDSSALQQAPEVERALAHSA